MSGSSKKKPLITPNTQFVCYFKLSYRNKMVQDKGTDGITSSKVFLSPWQKRDICFSFTNKRWKIESQVTCKTINSINSDESD